jgi:hypothetical protein
VPWRTFAIHLFAIGPVFMNRPFAANQFFGGLFFNRPEKPGAADYKDA